MILLEIHEKMHGISEDRLGASVVPAVMKSGAVSEIKKWKSNLKNIKFY